MNMLALIAGPTASGKSGLALELADKRGGVVINADAVAGLWRAPDIDRAAERSGTKARVPHALYGHVDVRETYTAAVLLERRPRRWRQPGPRTDCRYWWRNRPVSEEPYRWDCPVPEIDPQIRNAIRLRDAGTNFEQLAKLDPVASARLHPLGHERGWRGPWKWCAPPANRSTNGRCIAKAASGRGRHWPR